MLKIVGAYHEENSTHNSLHEEVAALVKPKKSFQIDPKCFQNIATELKKLFDIFY